MARGKLIVIESGIDGSGKSIQFELLYDRLQKEGYKVHKVKFPDYESASSALVRMYLEGDFGDNPQDINLYAVSTFYAVDRFASFQLKWKKLYEEGLLFWLIAIPPPIWFTRLPRSAIRTCSRNIWTG